MKKEFGYLLVSRNNSKMIEEWAEHNFYENVSVLNLDESTTLEESRLCKIACDKLGITYQSALAGGLVQNLKQAAEVFNEKGVTFLLYMHHDAYPQSRFELSKITHLINTNDLTRFGTIGFNVIHGEEAIRHYKPGSLALHTLSRAPLEPGDGWYRPTPECRFNFKRVELEPFAVECVMWTTLLISCETILDEIEVDPNFQFFHAWDDISFQLMAKNKWNMVVPTITFMHNQKFKVKHNLPENSPVKGSENHSVSHYYGRDDHLYNWEQKWAFRWDFRTYLQVALLPGFLHIFINKAVAKIANDYRINLRGKLDTVARRDFKKNNSRYKGSIIQEFYNHDPKSGPLRYFQDINTVH
jgi:hypothetical protein